MNDQSQNTANQQVVNVPNQLTALRLALSIVMFVLIGIAQCLGPDNASRQSYLYLAALVVFLVAAGTDWIDGYWARRFGQVTVVGRIFDPFVDKVIICGAFIFLVGSPGSRVSAWMAVIVVVREMLVTALRGFFEQRGVDFSAKMAGKLKMLLQCLAVAASLWLLTYAGSDRGAAPDWLTTSVVVLLWAAIITTIYSGVEYLLAAARLAKS
jgi:CDP-diacylglycerol--glycerol-3-phosphate 3-phosphatidyltransferase